MDFEKPYIPEDDYSSDIKEALEIDKNEFFILQSTRVVKRKGIEHAIESGVHTISFDSNL